MTPPKVTGVTIVSLRPAHNGLWAGIMNRRNRALFLAFFFCAASLLFGQSRTVNDRLIILNSSEAPGTLTKRAVASCLAQLAHEWKVQDFDLPKIVVLHVSQNTAAKVRITEKVAVRKDSVVGRATDYYEMWIVGEPDVRAIVVALENILESQFQMNVADEQRNKVITRVIRMEDATVDVQQMKDIQQGK